MSNELHSQLLTQIATLMGGRPATSATLKPIGGGCINQTYQLGDWFIKCNRPESLAMFAAEAAALTELGLQNIVRVPQPLWYGLVADHACLIMEYIPLQALNARAEERLGQQLAALHQQVQPYFGWQRDNTIGTTVQPNTQNSNWLHFWRDQRLAHQLRLAASKGYGGRLQQLGKQLLHELDELMADHFPHPALLHGDLWAGNVAMTAEQQPVIFDPASYYGDREADIAMTELFGGFGKRFYSAYSEAYPLDSVANFRFGIYNIYHILNHLNLFGGGYERQAEVLITSVLDAGKRGQPSW